MVMSVPWNSLFPSWVSLLKFTLSIAKCVSLTLSILVRTWDKVFKNGLSKICGRQPLKKFEGVCGLLGRLYPFKFFKGSLPQILLRLFLNTLTQLYTWIKSSFFCSYGGIHTNSDHRLTQPIMTSKWKYSKSVKRSEHQQLSQLTWFTNKHSRK